MLPQNPALGCCPGMLPRDAAMGCCPGMQPWDATPGCSHEMPPQDAAMRCYPRMQPWDATPGCSHGMLFWDAAQGCSHGLLPLDTTLPSSFHSKRRPPHATAGGRCGPCSICWRWGELFGEIATVENSSFHGVRFWEQGRRRELKNEHGSLPRLECFTGR